MTRVTSVPSRAGIVAVALWILLLLIAPPARNLFWGVNGLRSVPLPIAFAVVVVAALAAWIAARPPGGALLAPIAWLALAALVAFPLGESWHLLGDSSERWGEIANYVQHTRRASLSAWAITMHAQPLDVVSGLVLPGAIAARTHSVRTGISAATMLLGIVYLAGAWRLARRITGGAAPWAAWIALIAWGGLEAFAGYAESAAVALAAAVWWWVAMFTPLRRWWNGAALAGAWVLVFGAHRLGLVLLAPQLVRLLWAKLPGDAKSARGLALAGTLLAAAACALAMRSAIRGRLAGDLAELAHWPPADALASVPSDLANLVLLMAPLLLLAALCAGREAWRGALGEPRVRLALLAGLLLLPTAFPIPVEASGLGIQRDWDVSSLLGLSLTVAGMLVLARAPARRLRGALMLALPVAVLSTGGWIAMNADRGAASLRAHALVEDRPALGAIQASALYQMVGDRAIGLGRYEEGAGLLEQSWSLVPSPSRGVRAATAWYYAGQPERASEMMRQVLARGDVPAHFQADLDSLRAHLAAVSHVSDSDPLTRQ
jgi:hypothetical protein